MPAHLADELLEEDVEDATENSLISSEEIVLIQTAKSNILNPTNRMQVRVQMLYNSGSQRMYITERFARKLNLNGEKKVKFPLSLSGLRGHSHRIHLQLYFAWS